MRAKVQKRISNNKFTIRISKQNGGTFGSGKAYIKAASLCGGIAASKSYNSGVRYIDLDINTNMTLIRPASKSPFIQGLYKALNSEKDKTIKKEIQKEINLYVDNINLYYNKPDPATFTYTIEFTNNKSSNNYKLYYRSNTYDDIILTDVSKLSEVENKKHAIQNGLNAAWDIKRKFQKKNKQTQLESPKMSTRFTYNRIAAKEWANSNAENKSEYPSKTVQGTDCANFVSKALHQGGIPEDKTGKWYGSSTWGGYSGDN